MPGHWEGRTLAFRGERPWGERASVIHGSPIGKPYPSSVASLRSLGFSNLANWNIWAAKGRKIKRETVSSGERERNRAWDRSILLEAVSFDVDWMMEKPASSKRRLCCRSAPGWLKVSNLGRKRRQHSTGWGAQWTGFLKRLEDLAKEGDSPVN